MQELRSKSKSCFLIVAMCVIATLSGCTSTSRHALSEPPGLVASSESLKPSSSKKSYRASLYKPAVEQRGKSAIDRQVPALWARILDAYALPNDDHPRIERELEWFKQHPSYLERVQERATPYLYAIMEEMEAAGLPGEIALLPVVESAFRADAYSSQHAAGLWQFIPATGRHYGLRQTWWYDGRRDIHASTKAAVAYLSKLAEQFDNDWLLALAAYNCGEGNVARAIAKNRRLGKDTDYWSLPLPRETKRYVPKLLAVSKMFADAERYDMTLLDIPDRPYYEAIDIQSQLDIALAADMAEISVEEMFALNPGLNRWATDPDGPHHMLIPIEKADVFKVKLAALDDAERVQWRRHKIRRGDTLGGIAQRYGTTTRILKKINQLSSSRIRAGRHLLIPLSSEMQPILAQLPKQGNTELLHQVRPGDTFWDIARLYNVKISDLERWNNLDRGEPLQAGLKLAILVSGSEMERHIKYRVKKGDSLYVIAHQFNVSIDELRNWNNRISPESLRPGQVLLVKLDTSGPST